MEKTAIEKITQDLYRDQVIAVLDTAIAANREMHNALLLARTFIEPLPVEQGESEGGSLTTTQQGAVS